MRPSHSRAPFLPTTTPLLSHLFRSLSSLAYLYSEHVVTSSYYSRVTVAKNSFRGNSNLNLRRTVSVNSVREAPARQGGPALVLLLETVHLNLLGITDVLHREEFLHISTLIPLQLNDLCTGAEKSCEFSDAKQTEGQLCIIVPQQQRYSNQSQEQKNSQN